MTDLEKINELLDKVKNSTEMEIHQYWPSVVGLFIPMPKTERDKCAFAFYKWAEDNAEEQSLKLNYAEFLLGSHYVLSEEYELALQLLSKAAKSFEILGDDDGCAMCTLTIGVVYRSFGNFDLALKTLMTPFAHFKQTDKYPILLQGSCNSLANVNLELRNYDEAFSIFSIGYESGTKTGLPYFTIYALDGMGKARLMQGKHDEAKEYFIRALDESEKVKNPLNIGNALTELAVFNFKTGNLGEAEQLNKQALDIREQQKFTGAAVTSCINLGEIYIKQSRWDEALEVLEKGLALAEKIKVKPKMYQVHLLLSKVYKGKGNLEQSYHHYELFHELREKVQEEDNARKLMDAKLIFEAEQTKKENIIIKKQKQEIENKNHQLQETIEELTITKISRKARGLTLLVGIALIIIEEPIFHYVLRYVGEEQFFLNVAAKVVIIISLKPIDKAIEGYLLRRLVLRRRKQAATVNE